jgi:Tol biopolymer transport system component
LEVNGASIELVDDLLVHPDGRIAYYSISQSNMLLYRPNSESTHLRRLLSVDRDGLESPLIDDLRYFSTSSFSPNGRELALCIDLDVWVLDLERNSLNRFTFDRAYDYTPIWTPDGKWITFGSMRSGPANLYWKPSDGSGPAQRILENENDNYPCSWSPDGKVLAFLEISPDTGNDIWMYPTGDEQQPYPFINTPSSEMQAQFSPDGRWLAYTSNESGRPEVYVQPFPGPGGKWQVSKDGGFAPIWASDGSTIYFATPQESVMSTSVRSAPHFTVTKLQELFTLRGGTGFVAGRSFDISPDGQRFVFAQSQEPRETTQLNLIFDWVEAMRRRASAEN